MVGIVSYTGRGEGYGSNFGPETADLIVLLKMLAYTVSLGYYFFHTRYFHFIMYNHPVTRR